MKKDTDKNILPAFGVGPLYVIVCAVITVAGIVLDCLEIISMGEIVNLPLKIVFYIFGGILVVSGIVMWLFAVVIGNVDKDIESGKLKTTGIYAVVRNPIYSAFLFVFTGILLFFTNLYLLVLPVLYYIYMTVLVIYTEERWLKEKFGEEYVIYCKKVNRCLPWLRQFRQEL